MGWLHVVGSFKLQVPFAKEPYELDNILQKRPIILRSLLIVATPYICSPIKQTGGVKYVCACVYVRVCVCVCVCVCACVCVYNV